MNNVFNQNSWNSEMRLVHVEPPPIPSVKVKYHVKSDKDLLKLKPFRDPTSSTSKLYKFNIPLFQNCKLEELLFVRNFNKTLMESGTLEVGAKFQFLCMLVHRE